MPEAHSRVEERSEREVEALSHDVVKSDPLAIHVNACYNWIEKGLGFAQAMTPIIEKLYTAKETLLCLKRHLVGFTPGLYRRYRYRAVIARKKNV
jgi:mannose/fructose/N-acetylgalactosamine-specific phosphotransferase system component IID